MQDFQGRPIAHTCRPLLGLSDTYKNFSVLREDFQQVLSPNMWNFES